MIGLAIAGGGLADDIGAAQDVALYGHTHNLFSTYLSCGIKFTINW